MLPELRQSPLGEPGNEDYATIKELALQLDFIRQ